MSASKFTSFSEYLIFLSEPAFKDMSNIDLIIMTNQSHPEFTSALEYLLLHDGADNGNPVDEESVSTTSRA